MNLWLAQVALLLLTTLINATATATAPTDRLAILTQRGIAVQSGGQITFLHGTKDVETISTSTFNHCVIGTRGREIVLVPLDGRAITSTYQHVSTVRFPAVSPDGKSVAFCSAGDAQSDGRIWLGTMNDQHKLVDVDSITAHSGYGPTFSSDGRWLYFESNGLIRMDLQTHATEPFLPEFNGAYTVNCSRDGRYIAFSHERALYIYKTSDQSVKKLTAGQAYDRLATFSGDQIYFVRHAPDSAGKQSSVVCRMSVNGGEPEVLYQSDAELVCIDPADR
jgi:Tol biopolymer transport system component